MALFASNRSLSLAGAGRELLTALTSVKTVWPSVPFYSTVTIRLKQNLWRKDSDSDSNAGRSEARRKSRGRESFDGCAVVKRNLSGVGSGNGSGPGSSI